MKSERFEVNNEPNGKEHSMSKYRVGVIGCGDNTKKRDSLGYAMASVLPHSAADVSSSVAADTSRRRRAAA